MTARECCRYIKQIIPTILGKEVAVVRQLHMRIKIFVFILVVLGTAAFSFVAYFIFNDVAVQVLHQRPSPTFT